MIFIDPRRTVPYVIEAQREAAEAERVTFQLGVLTATQWAEAADVAGMDRDLYAGTFGLALLREGLRGWSGPGGSPFLADAAGRPTADTLTRLSPAVRMEVARAIYRLNVMGDADAGKS